MKISYIVLDAQFESNEDIDTVRKEYNVTPIDVTQVRIEQYKSEGHTYCGPSLYMFIGKEMDLVKYLLYGYPVEDLEELKDCIMDIKSIDI